MDLAVSTYYMKAETAGAMMLLCNMRKKMVRGAGRFFFILGAANAACVCLSKPNGAKLINVGFSKLNLSHSYHFNKFQKKPAARNSQIVLYFPLIFNCLVGNPVSKERQLF